MSRDVFSFEATPEAIHEVIRTLKTEEDLYTVNDLQVKYKP
jgi:hypothetical protein